MSANTVIVQEEIVAVITTSSSVDNVIVQEDLITVVATTEPDPVVITVASMEPSGASEVRAKYYAEAAKSSEEAAQASENAAKASEIATKASQDAAKASQDAAKASETGAKASQDAAKVSQDAAKVSQDAAKASEIAAYASQLSSEASASDSAAYASAAAASAANSAAASNTASQHAEAARLSANAAEQSRGIAEAEAAKATQSASAAKASETAAKASETAAKTSETTAATKAAEASASASTATTKAAEASASASTATTKAAEASASASVANTKAAEASASAVAANEAKVAAESAASSLAGGIIDKGTWDASTGVFPAKPTRPVTGGGTALVSAFWKVTVAGIVNSIDFRIGDDLRFSAGTDEFYKVDNTDAVSSVQGKVGIVTLNAAEVGALGTPTGTHSTDTVIVAGTTPGTSKYSGFTLAKSVPSDAVFTDTVYTHPTSDGNKHVPATGTTNNRKVLMAGATAGSFSWSTPTTADVSGLDTALAGKLPIDGNAASASKLQTPVTINGVSFDGSANITINAASPNTLTRGTGLIGGNYNGSAATTWSVAYGSAAGTAAEGNDPRLSDARVPLAHVHAIDEVTGLQTALDSKYSSSNKPTAADVGAVAALGGNCYLQTQDFGLNLSTSVSSTSGSWARAYQISGGASDANKFRVGAFGSGSDIGWGFLNINGDYHTENSLRIYPTYASWGDYKLYHQGFKPTAADVGAAPSAHNHDVLLALDLRTVNPSSAGISGSKAIRSFFTNLSNWGGWTGTGHADTVVFDTYTDNSGGAVNALSLSKNGCRAFLSQGSHNGTTWAETREIVTKNSAGVPNLTAAEVGALQRIEGDGHLIVPEGKWWRAASYFTGFLPYSPNTSDISSYIGVHDWWFREAWVYSYRGNHVNVAGAVTAYSDKRVKDNIKNIPNALNKVLALNGVTYTRIDQEDKEKLHTGVIAQEVEAVLPEAVLTSENGDIKDFKSVAYGNLVGLLIEAIKDLKSEINSQQAIVASLKQEVEDLKNGNANRNN